MKTLIVQTSPRRTGSTVLVNILYGLIPTLHMKRIMGDWMDGWESTFLDDEIIAIKCHHLDLDEFIQRYETKYKIYYNDKRTKNNIGCQ